MRVLVSIRVLSMVLATWLLLSPHTSALGDEGLSAGGETCTKGEQVENAEEAELQAMNVELLQRNLGEASASVAAAGVKGSIKTKLDPIQGRLNITTAHVSTAATNLVLGVNEAIRMVFDPSYVDARSLAAGARWGSVLLLAAAKGVKAGKPTPRAVGTVQANTSVAAGGARADGAKGFPSGPSIINEVRQITEARRLRRVSSALETALGPLERGIDSFANSTIRSMESLLDAILSVKATERVQTFQRKVVATLDSTAERLDWISLIAKMAINVSELALDAFGQDSLADQISSTLGDIPTFFDNFANLLRQASSKLTDLDLLPEEVLLEWTKQLRNTLFAVIDNVHEFEASINTKLTDFLNSTAGHLYIPVFRALGPIQGRLNTTTGHVCTAAVPTNPDGDFFNDVVESIWLDYDTDKNGVLDKVETERFLKACIEQTGWGELSEEAFNKNFESIDKNGSGTIEKDEMTDGLILKLLESKHPNP